jgi:methionyl aminopeptidase
MVTLKNQAELDQMRAAGHVVGVTLRRVADAVEPGISLAELEAIGAACIKEHGAESSFLGYRPQ